MMEDYVAYSSGVWKVENRKAASWVLGHPAFPNGSSLDRRASTNILKVMNPFLGHGRFVKEL